MDGVSNSVDNMSLSKLWEMVKVREAWCAAVHGITRSQKGLSALNSVLALLRMYSVAQN